MLDFKRHVNTSVALCTIPQILPPAPSKSQKVIKHQLVAVLCHAPKMTIKNLIYC